MIHDRIEQQEIATAYHDIERGRNSNEEISDDDFLFLFFVVSTKRGSL
jgi:hypothetical protein